MFVVFVITMSKNAIMVLIIVVLLNIYDEIYCWTFAVFVYSRCGKLISRCIER